MVIYSMQHPNLTSGCRAVMPTAACPADKLMLLSGSGAVTYTSMLRQKDRMYFLMQSQWYTSSSCTQQQVCTADLGQAQGVQAAREQG
jgi:hypothetical protein